MHIPSYIRLSNNPHNTNTITTTTNAQISTMSNVPFPNGASGVAYGIWVGNLDPAATKDHVAQVFGIIGPLCGPYLTQGPLFDGEAVVLYVYKERDGGATFPSRYMDHIRAYVLHRFRYSWQANGARHMDGVMLGSKRMTVAALFDRREWSIIGDTPDPT